jgi:hypothetical protein
MILIAISVYRTLARLWGRICADAKMLAGRT